MHTASSLSVNPFLFLLEYVMTSFHFTSLHYTVVRPLEIARLPSLFNGYRGMN